jgi:hypothetical protein
MEEKSTFTFKRYPSLKDSCDTLVSGIIEAHKAMDKEGLLKEDTTFEEVAEWAGRHILITEEPTPNMEL